jgi:hypothetical protein
MGVTIHYRGTVDDIGQIETMEDRILDLVFALGGRATIWRSFSDPDSPRVVRGLIVNLEPGQDTFSLLVSPEGHLTPLFQIHDAENAPFDEPPYCFVKTQFGSLLGHIAIVHLLDALRQRFCSNLVVSDEGEYYENRDVDRLIRKRNQLRVTIDLVADGLREHGMSREAAEDPNILAARIERIAAIVQQKMISDGQAALNTSDVTDTKEDHDSDWEDLSLEQEVELMDQLRRKNDLRSERMTRRIAEATASGMTVEEAFDLAMKEEGLPIPSGDLMENVDSTPDESWRESSSVDSFDGAVERLFRDNHPAVAEARAFLMEVMDLAEGDVNSSFVSTLVRAGMDIVGGLVQATCEDPEDPDDKIHRALNITQLKRALSGHAYARGAIFGLHSDKAITKDQSDSLHNQLESLLGRIHALSEAAWMEKE